MKHGSVEFVKFLVEEMHVDLRCFDSIEVLETISLRVHNHLIREYLAMVLHLNNLPPLR